MNKTASSAVLRGSKLTCLLVLGDSEGLFTGTCIIRFTGLMK